MEETRVRHLARLTAAAALGRRDVLSTWYAAALAAGLPLADLQEATLQVYLFAGFPRALGAFEALGTACGEGAPPPPPPVEEGGADFASRGDATFGLVYGPHAERVAGELRSLHPDFARFVLVNAYGQVLGRPFLPIAEREVLAVAMLAVLGQRRQLRAHVRGALRVGVAPATVRLALAGAEEAAGAELPGAREVVGRALAAAPPDRTA